MQSLLNQNSFSMKNIQFIFAICLFSLATVNAQNGKINISAGVGFEPTVILDNAEVNSLPMTFKLGYQFSPIFSLNAFAGYSSTTSQPNVINDGLALRTNMEQSFVGLRGELKKGFSDRFEVYGGAALGYVRQKRTETSGNGAIFIQNSNEPSKFDPNTPKGRMLYSGFVGTNIFVTKHVGLFAEIGYGVALFNGGVTARF